MRKAIKILLIAGLLFMIGYFGFKTFHKIKLQKHATLNTVTIPIFSFQTIDHHIFRKENIQDTLGNIVIMLFSPDCEHCQYMANAMVKNKKSIEDIQFVMVTPFGDSASVAQFKKAYGLNILSNVKLLLDTHDDFHKIFGTSLVPSFFVYKNNRLVKSIKGETKIENLIN